MSRPLLAALVLLVALALGTAVPAVAQTTEADVYVAQAIIEIDEKKYDEALANLKKALEVNPDHVEALYYMGVVHAAQRKPGEAVPFLEKARAKSPTDPAIAFQLGLAYFAGQQYNRAQPLFEEVFKTNPDLDGLGYYTGFLRYRSKDYRGALAAFRAGRSSDVEIQQLTRFYTGLALGVLGMSRQAAAEVEQALRLAPGTPLIGPAERLRDTLVAQRAAERRFSAEVRLGVTYDDNVDVRPTANNREPQVAELRTHRHETFGELFGARADYIWWKTDEWQSTVGYSFFTTYNNDIPKFNVIDHLATLGVSHGVTFGELPGLLSAQYTAIGDTVNLAARLESITKDYHASIIISESTYEYVKGQFPTRGLGEVTVKGKTVPVKIYAVLPPDIRKYPRMVLDAGAVLTDPVTGQVRRVRTRDISEGGLALTDVPGDWTVGSKIQIRLDGGDLAKPILAEGTIAWRRGDDAGVNFTQVESESVAEYVSSRQARRA